MDLVFDISRYASRGEFSQSACYKYFKQRVRCGTVLGGVSSQSLQGCRVLIVVSPGAHYSADELDAMKAHLIGGGSVIVLYSDVCGESNINYFLEEYGMSVSDESLISAVHVIDGLHPTELVVPFGTSGQLPESHCVLRHGASLLVRDPARVIMTSGPKTFPVNRPVVGAWQSSADGSASLITVSAGAVLSDDYFSLEKEHALSGRSNIAFLSYLLDLAFGNLNLQSVATCERTDSAACVPDLMSLSSIPRTCFLDVLGPADRFIPSEHSLFMNIDESARIDELCKVLGLVEPEETCVEGLKLLPPLYEVPMPDLVCALPNPLDLDIPNLTGPCAYIRSEGPALELVDLDAEFATARTKLEALVQAGKSEFLSCAESLLSSPPSSASKGDPIASGIHRSHHARVFDLLSSMHKLTASPS